MNLKGNLTSKGLQGSIGKSRMQGILGTNPAAIPITVDNALSLTSTNPVQNKVITAALGNAEVYQDHVIVEYEDIQGSVEDYSDIRVSLSASTAVNKQFWNASTGAAVSNNNGKYSRYNNIGQYSKLYISGLSYSSTYPLAAYYDSNNVLLKTEFTSVVNSRPFVGFASDVPSGASYVVVNGSNVTNKVITPSVSALDVGKSEFNNLIEISGEQNVGTAWRNTGENLPTAENYVYTKYTTIPDSQYVYISGESWGTAYPLVCFYNSGNTLISSYGTLGSSLYEGIELQIPTGTAYYCVNGHATEEDTKIQYPKVAYIPAETTRVITKTQADLNKALNRKYLFVGDSYAEGYSHDGNNDGWISYLAGYLGLSDGEYVGTYTGGYNFSSGTFENLMSAVTADDITDVVVCGGYNDRSATESAILTGISSFVSTAKLKWPGVTVRVGFIAYNKQGNGTGAIPEWQTIRTALLNTVLPTYQKGITVGAVYLNNVEYWLNEDGLTPSDGYHPSATGNQYIAMAIANALRSGSAPLPHNEDLRLS